MKKLFIVLFVVIVRTADAQTAISSCEGSDSLMAAYQQDAYQLTMRNIYANESPYLDFVALPEVMVDNILGGLVAIINSQLPSVDTILALPDDIHARSLISTQRLIFRFYPASFQYDDNWFNGQTLTGNSLIDPILIGYQFSLSDTPFTIGNAAYAILVTPLNINLFPIAEHFEQYGGASDSWPDGDGFDGSDIYYTDTFGVRDYRFYFGYGDCPSGCICKHYWKFRVYPDCSVSMDSSYGCSLAYFFTSANTVKPEKFSVYPNPFSGIINVTAPTNSEIVVHDLLGRNVYISKLSSDGELDLSFLNGGLYFLRVNSGGDIHVIKLMKH